MRKLVLCLLLAHYVYAADPAWIVYGPDGPLARTIVTAGGTQCPSILLDGVAKAMTVHATPTKSKYPVLVCELLIPGGTATASVNGVALPVAKIGQTTKVAILGDTGCRRKNGDPPQSCNPPDWPFATVAGSIAAWEPDLILHVGDYYYREATSCTDTECSSDTTYDWKRWNADFFTPAGDLLNAAPWVMVRGNHEKCSRAAEGYFRFIDPRSYQWNGKDDCKANLDYTPPYLVTAGSRLIMVMDSSACDDTNLNTDQAATYAKQIGSLPISSGSWLMLHHPFWGVRKSGPTTQTLWSAWKQAGDATANIALVLSGHQHLFEALGFSDGRPPQVIAGNGGTALAKAPKNETPQPVGDRTLTQFEIYDKFGYIAATSSGNAWTFSIRSPNGDEKGRCAVTETNIVCD